MKVNSDDIDGNDDENGDDDGDDADVEDDDAGWLWLNWNTS